MSVVFGQGGDVSIETTVSTTYEDCITASTTIGATSYSNKIAKKPERVLEPWGGANVFRWFGFAIGMGFAGGSMIMPGIGGYGGGFGAPAGAYGGGYFRDFITRANSFH